MRFTDFRMRDLVGKPVVWTIAGQGQGTIKTITKISKCLDNGFTIEGEPGERIFNYRNGHQKAITGRMTHTISFCELVTNDQVNELRNKWKSDQERYEMIEFIKNNLDKLTNHQLQDLQNQLK